MNSIQIFYALERIAATSSRNDKEALLAEYIADEHFKKVVRYAYDPMITFGLKPPKLPKEAGEFIIEFGSEPWPTLNALNERRLTGNAARDLVLETMKSLERASQEVFWRILSKDLRCGITATTINKVLPGTVPIFSVMLAHKYEEKRITKFPVAVEPKLDGLRVIGLVRDGSAKFFSRTGKHFPSLDHLGPAVVKMVERAYKVSTEKYSGMRQFLGDDAPRLALDAEIISGSFNKTTGDVRRKDEAAEDAVLHLFDAIPFDVMTGVDSEFSTAYRHRRQNLEFLVSFTDQKDPIEITPMRLASSYVEIDAIYNEHRANGLEGAMVKHRDGIYSKKRSHAWLKIKNEETEDLRVVSMFEGTGKFKDSLGGLIVDRNGVEVRVGGGFSDDLRNEIWSGRINAIGRLIEVEFHEITPDGSLRHPRFVGWRDDKDGELEAA